MSPAHHPYKTYFPLQCFQVTHQSKKTPQGGTLCYCSARCLQSQEKRRATETISVVVLINTVLFFCFFLIVSRHPVSSFLYLQIHDITGFLGNVCLMFHMYQLYVWIFPNGNCLLVLTEQMSNEKTCTTTNLHVKKRWKNKSNICF